MKKKLINFLSLTLIGVMSFQLMACGNGEKSQEDGLPKKEFLYVPEYVELEENSFVEGLCSDGKGFYYKVYNYEEETGQSEEVIKYYDIETKELTDFLFSYPTSETEGTDSHFQQMKLSADGKELILLKNDFISGNSDEWESKFSIVRVSAEDGSILSETDITDALGMDAESAYIAGMCVDSDGYTYVADGNGRILVFDSELQKQFEIDLNGNMLRAMGRTREGNVAYAVMSQTGEGMELNVIDTAKKGVSKTCTQNVPYVNNMREELVPGISAGVLMSGENGLTEYDFEKEISTPVMDWVDSDIYSDQILSDFVLEDGRIVVLLTDYSSESATNEIAILTKTPVSEIADKEIITMAVLYQSPNVGKAVVDFNKKSDRYHINLVNYSADSGNGSGDDWETTLIRFNNDVASGNGADIFDLGSVNMKMLAEKGAIEDLLPYLEKDGEISAEDYFPSVLDAFSIDGKLYTIPSLVYIQTLFGKSSEVGTEPGWTMDDLMELVNSRPEGTEVLNYATKDTVLQMCLGFDMDSYIDWSTGECKFDSDDFIKILEFANRFPKEYEYSEDEENAASKLQSGKLLLVNEGLNTVQDYQMISEMFGEPVTAIGYPTAQGIGSAFMGENMFGINAKSGHKEGAWEFLKSLIGPEYYENNTTWGIPSLISAYDAMNEKYMEPQYSEDEDGNQTEQPQGTFGTSDGFSTDIYAATREDIDAVTDIINSCNRVYNLDPQLYNIISEETAPFFEGQKGVKEAAEIIQSRVQMYVSENR